MLRCLITDQRLSSQQFSIQHSVTHYSLFSVYTSQWASSTSRLVNYKILPRREEKASLREVVAALDAEYNADVIKGRVAGKG